MQFDVWVPFASRVELALEDRRVEMAPRGGGWWHSDVPGAGDGIDYGFVVDGEGPFPDPRSPWQPAGVHGRSRTVDHGGFSWRSSHWPELPLAQAIIYELHIGTFTPDGTFDSAIERLDYLVQLGVTHVELMPVAHFSGERGWGYDGVHLYAPHEAYGGPDGLKRLVDACHLRGLRVLLDVVYNHLGPSGNYLERFGPYFTDRYHTPWGKAVNFDQAYSDEVRRFVIDNALMWLRDYRFDGLRLDAVHAILDQSAVHILEQLAGEVRALESASGRRYDIIAESDLNDPRLVQRVERGGYGLDGVWSDDFHHAVHALLTGEVAGYYEDFGRMSHLADALSHIYVYDGEYSQYRRRRHGRAIGNLPASRFIIASQNHDQVGNRAKGERLAHLAGIERAKIAAAITLLAPGVPLLFQGEEWASSSPFQYFTAHEDVELGRAVSEGRKSEFAAFGWEPADVPDPQDAATYERSHLRWDEIEREPHRDMLEWYRALLALRRAVPSLSDGDLRNVHLAFDEGERWLTMTRGEITLALNLSDNEREVTVPGGLELKLASRPDTRYSNGHLNLPPDSMAVLIGNE